VPTPPSRRRRLAQIAIALCRGAAGPDPSTALVGRFNDCINRRDLDGLARLMSDDHTLVDTAGSAVTGISACVSAWRGFFAAFPDYRNVFTDLTVRAHTVNVVGRSFCSEPALSGPALWTVVVREDKVTVWRVHDDTAENRRQLGHSDVSTCRC
jgi:hypothetical protein